MDVEVPQFTDHLRELILQNATSDFDWSEISPTIFGGVFESTLNPDQRRKGGMHYTSIENIHKVINPLFLNDLKEELNEIKQLKQPAAIKRRAQVFQNKLSSLTFFDPASGSGNFLTETYLSLRELENECLSLVFEDRARLDTGEELIKVTLDQFYGLEINDFAVSVAKTALWIAESQMFEKTKDLIFSEVDFFPLKSYTNIKEGNALKVNWNSVIDKRDLNYIIGNPPFIGYKLQSIDQKKDLEPLFGKIKSIDYVAGWFYKSAEFIENSDIRVALVATNSICQGEQVETVWSTLIDKFKVDIDFAYTSFKWNNETKNAASVYCVIVGFSHEKNFINPKLIFSSSENYEIAENINPYLANAPTIFVRGRNQPLSNVDKMIYGSEPREGGYLILTEADKQELIEESPFLDIYIKRFVSSSDYINDNYRYCLWLVDADLSKIRTSKIVMNRLQSVKEFRLNSKQKQANKSAVTPYLFTSIRQPKTDYLLVPIVSSENRRYIPIGYVDKDTIVSNACNTISNASLYTFGIMTSNVHMSWMRVVAGRLKSDYRYSAQLVYNTFPWPDTNDRQKEEIEKTAQKILDARNLYPNATLADLYDELIMPIELRKAHQDNDRAVMQAYGMDIRTTSESDAVAKLFKLYSALI